MIYPKLTRLVGVTLVWRITTKLSNVPYMVNFLLRHHFNGTFFSSCSWHHFMVDYMRVIKSKCIMWQRQTILQRYITDHTQPPDHLFTCHPQVQHLRLQTATGNMQILPLLQMTVFICELPHKWPLPIHTELVSPSGRLPSTCVADALQLSWPPGWLVYMSDHNFKRILTS